MKRDSGIEQIMIQKYIKGVVLILTNDISSWSSYFLSQHKRHKSSITVKTALKNEVMIQSFNYDKQSEKIYLMIEGLALIKVQNIYGKKDFYSLASKNQMFGIEILLEESQRPKDIYYSVIAQTNVSYLEIDRQFFLDYLFKESKIPRLFFFNMVRQYLFLAQSYQLMNESVSIRITNTLIELIDVLEILPNEKGVLTFPKIINQEFIANYTNASVARTSTVFKNLEKNKIIKRKPIQIIDLNKLKQLLLLD